MALPTNDGETSESVDEKGPFHIRVSGPGVSFEGDVPQSVAGKILLMAMTGQAGQAAPDLPAQVRSFNRGLSLREFLNDRQARRVPEKIATIAYFLREFKNQETFSREDVVRAFEEAREPTPANIWRDLSASVQLGWITPKSGEKDRYYVTGTGGDAVEKGFSPGLRKSVSVRKKKRTEGKSQGVQGSG